MSASLWPFSKPKFHMEPPKIESVLFSSPYSGCRQFSGWALYSCVKPGGTTFPSAYAAPGARLCVERYHKVAQGPKTPLAPKCGPARATVTLSTPPYRLRAIQGPSSSGPWTVYSHFDEKGGDEFGSGPTRGAGHNLGLG